VGWYLCKPDRQPPGGISAKMLLSILGVLVGLALQEKIF
jgi:hypothetical protein